MTKRKAPPADKILSRQRRKEERPSEIVEVATVCFLESGYEATKLEEVARRSGIAKGTIYLYFETKEKLFRAVVQHVAGGNLKHVSAAVDNMEGSLEHLLPLLVNQIVQKVGKSRAPGIARLILRESDRFPDLARVWYEDAVTPLLATFEGVLKKAQERGEIRDGDTRLLAFSLFGPITTGLLFSQLVSRIGYEPLDLERLAKQHVEVILRGLLVNQNRSD